MNLALGVMEPTGRRPAIGASEDVASKGGVIAIQLPRAKPLQLLCGDVEGFVPVHFDIRIAAAPVIRAGAVLLVDRDGTLSGIFTDADLRRKLTERGPGEWMRDPIATVMTRSPTTLPESALVRDAVRLTREKRLDEIPIVCADGKPVGILDVQDLIAMRLVKDEDQR